MEQQDDIGRMRDQLKKQQFEEALLEEKVNEIREEEAVAKIKIEEPNRQSVPIILQELEA